MKNLSTCMRRENKWVLLATSFHNHTLLDPTEQNWIIYSSNRENKTKPTDYFSGTEVKKLNFLFASFILSPIHSFLPITPHIPTVFQQAEDSICHKLSGAPWMRTDPWSMLGNSLVSCCQMMCNSWMLPAQCFLLSRDINSCHPSISERAMLFQASSSLFKCG